MKQHTIFAATALSFSLTGYMTIPDSNPLTGTQWQLVAIDNAGSTATLPPALQGRHTVNFLDGGELQLQLDCNRGRSTWTAGQPSNGAGSISIGPVVGTKMFCPAPSFGDQLASGLSAAQRFATTKGGSELVLETPGQRMTFAAIK